MTAFLCVKNWQDHQHYRDRQPAWIKLHRSLLNNLEFHTLSDEAGKALPLLWLIAAETNGILPTIGQLAFRLRYDHAKTARIVEELSAAEFLVSDVPAPKTEVEWGSRHIPDAVKRAVFARDGGRCRACGSPDHIEYDHIMPVSKGGQPTEDNVQLLCRSCNRRKRTKVAAPPVEQVATQAEPPATQDVDSRSLEEEKQETSNKIEAALPARDPRFGEVYRRLESILGTTAFDGSRIHAWLASGADPELDIYPAVERRKGTGPPKPLKYFDGPIADSIANRTNGLPHGKSNGHSTAKPKRGGTAEIRAGIARAVAERLGESGAGSSAGGPEVFGMPTGPDG